jgi:hypothetical protein
MKDAYAQADEIEMLDPDAGRWARAMVCLKDRKPEEAFALYAGTLESRSTDYTELIRLGQLSQWTGLYLEQGKRAFETCLTLPPAPDQAGHDQVHFALGQIHEIQKNTEAARLAYEAALVLNPTSTATMEALRKLN